MNVFRSPAQTRGSSAATWRLAHNRKFKKSPLREPTVVWLLGLDWPGGDRDGLSYNEVNLDSQELQVPEHALHSSAQSFDRPPDIILVESYTC